MNAQQGRELNGWHVFAGLFAFFFVVMLVNAIFTFVALDTWSGLDSKDAYSKGVEYNDLIEVRERQKELGWESALRAVPLDDGSYEIIADFRNRDGVPLNWLTVSADFVRPTHIGYDFNIEMEPLGDGQYRAQVTLPLQGVWDINLAARRGQTDEFHGKSRVYIE